MKNDEVIKMRLLIKVLLDSSALVGDRDDAALDLGFYDDDEALAALIHIASTSEEEPFLRDVCGESIAQIWVKRNTFDAETFSKLLPESQYEAKSYIKAHKPEWLQK